MDKSSIDPQEWFRGKEFTTDWLSRKIPYWIAPLAHLREQAADVLEIGSYEGRSAVAFLSYLSNCNLTCIDTFQLRDSSVEERFDRNVSEYNPRVRKIKSQASIALDDLRREKKEFDVVYIDAGKDRDWVFALSSLTWPLVRIGGVIIWDDFTWGIVDKESKDRPHDAIKLFQNSFADCLKVLHQGSQLISCKVADWPSTTDSL